MAYLNKYIRQILSKKERVILPGFGSLLIKEGKGVPSGDGRIEPPGAIVVFDAEQPMDDGKLAEAFATGEGIDPEESRQQLLELVDAIKFKLDKGEEYTLELVGTFSRDDNNKVHFSKDPGWILDPELFGLSTLDLIELEDEAEEVPVPTADPVMERATEEEPVSAPVVERMRRAPVNKWRIIWIVVASLIVVLVLILIIPTGGNVEFGKDGIVIRDRQKEKTGQPIESRAVPGESGEVKKPLQAEKEPAVEQETTPVAPKNHYFIIAGSFQNLQNASELMDEFKNNGFPSEIIFTENRLYRVSIHSFPSKEQALQELNRIKKQPGLESCWLLTR